MKRYIIFLICVAVLILLILPACQRPASTAPFATATFNELPFQVITQPPVVPDSIELTQEARSMAATRNALSSPTPPVEEVPSETPGEQLMLTGVATNPPSINMTLTAFSGGVNTAMPGYGTATPYGTPPAPAATAATPVFYVFEGVPGLATFGIRGVIFDQSVTIVTHEFPKNDKFSVYMGPAGTLGLNGILIGTYDSGEGGSITATYQIPAGLKGSGRIDMRIEFSDGNYANNYFFNRTSN